MKQYPVQPQISMEPLSVGHESREEVKTDTLRWFTHLLQTRPMAFWGGVWVSVFLVAIVAVGSLMSPNAAERRSVSAIAVGSDSVVATQPLDKKGQVPFWLFGAIAITCTAGSLLVSRQLNSKTPLRRRAVSRRRRVQKMVVSSSVSQSPMSKKRLATKPKQQIRKVGNQPQRLKPYSPTEGPFSRPQPVQRIASIPVELSLKDESRHVATPSFTVKQSRLTQTRTAEAQLNRKPSSRGEMPKSTRNVPVTIVPEDQVHPLDWQAPRLADAVDLRRRKSMKSWM